MKILLLTRNYPSEKDYAYAFVHARAKMYVQKSQKVIVVVPTQETSAEYFFEGIHVLRTPSYSVAEIFCKYDPDILAVHGLPLFRDFMPILKNIIMICRKIGTPVITWIHGAEAQFVVSHHYYGPLGLRSNLIRFGSALYDPIKRVFLTILLMNSTCVVFASRWMQNTCEKYIFYRHPNSFIIPNPIDTLLFKRVKTDRKDKIREGVSVRSLEWKYGLDIAVKSFADVDARLTILGRGSLENYLKALATLYKANVVFQTTTIPHNKMPEFYRRYDFFVAPSRTEGQGLAMCEAMSCGLPSIATSVGGIPEFVRHEVTGLLVPPEDPLSLRKAIKKLISNKEMYEYLSRNASEFCQKNLSFNAVYAKEYKLFKKSLELT